MAITFNSGPDAFFLNTWTDYLKLHFDFTYVDFVLILWRYKAIASIKSFFMALSISIYILYQNAAPL